MERLFTRLPAQLVQTLRTLDREMLSQIEEIRIYSSGKGNSYFSLFCLRFYMGE